MSTITREVKDIIAFISDSLDRDLDKDGISESYPALVNARARPGKRWNELIIECDSTVHTIIVDSYIPV